MKRLVIIIGALALAGCGNIGPLEPAPGQPLPVKPLLARSTPTAEDLLDRPPYANPERVDELVTRSEPRRPDRFDLPPPDGGAVPAYPAGTDPQPKDDETGPSDPQ